MSATPSSDYVLGGADVEHDRLIRQGRRLAKFTDHLFREAGVGPGQRVLDIGSGVGEVALLVAHLVGGSGSVVGVDRDLAGLAKARARVAEAGLGNVQFIESDIASVHDGRPFDAIVGRFVLMFQPDPVAVLRALSACLRPGGVIVLQEASWPAFLSQVARLPLWTACATLICEALRRGKCTLIWGWCSSGPSKISDTRCHQCASTFQSIKCPICAVGFTTSSSR